MISRAVESNYLLQQSVAGCCSMMAAGMQAPTATDHNVRFLFAAS